MAIGGIEVVAFEMRGGRQHDIAVLHAFRHRDLDADEEDVFARQSALHAILVGMHDDRIVIVDEERPERRVDVVALEMTADVVDVQGSRAGSLDPEQQLSASSVEP